MKKIQLNHETTSLAGAFGISDKRFTEMQKAVAHGMVESITTEKKSETYQYVLDLIKPQSQEEVLLVGFLLGASESLKALHEAHHEERSRHPLSEILRKEAKVHES